MSNLCLYCQTQMDNARRKQCGSPECSRKHNAERGRAFMKSYRERTGQSYNRRYRDDPEKWAAEYARNKAKWPDRTCTVCGAVWKSNFPAARFCTVECQNFARFGPRSSPVPEKHPARAGKTCPVPERHPARAKQRASRTFIGGECVRCGVAFLVESYVPASFCSARCARAEANTRRRALERAAHAEYVRRDIVFHRDKWMCKLCNRPMDRDVRAPHPLAPTLDHIVPLARGGAHSMDNAQSAHFLCNARKGHRV